MVFLIEELNRRIRSVKNTQMIPENTDPTKDSRNSKNKITVEFLTNRESIKRKSNKRRVRQNPEKRSKESIVGDFANNIEKGKSYLKSKRRKMKFVDQSRETAFAYRRMNKRESKTRFRDFLYFSFKKKKNEKSGVVLIFTSLP